MILILLMILIFIISILIYVINLLLSKKMYLDREKNSSFECGFDMLSSSRLPFSIHFYLIAILFLIFDMEVVFLFPIIDLFYNLNFYEWLYVSLMIMLILYFGLEFEKSSGSLKWFLYE